MLIPNQVFVSLLFLKDTVAAAGTALLLGAAAMSHQQDPAAASAPFDSSANVAAIRTLAQDEPSADQEPRTIQVVAKRFAFDPARIEVMEGERIRLVVKSEDGVHGLEIQKFGVNQRIPRGGEPVTIDFVASAPGEYPIACSQYCGDGHDDMKGMLVVAAKGAASGGAAPSASAPATTTQHDDPDRDPNDSQPDFYVATLNTNLRLPKGKMAFRLTHRFLRTLGDGDFGDLASRFFGLDSGAQIGLELKYAPFRGGQVGFYRTSDRTIQFQGSYNAIQDGNGPVGVSVVANVDGTDNFSDEFSPGVAIVLSRELGDRGAVYLQPSFIGNTNLINKVGDDYTAMAGVGARLRLGHNTYIFAEGSPRLAGYKQGVTMVSFGFEGRAGGHVFQLNFSNGYGTTLAQVARGGTGKDDWYLGFNLSRKFY